MTKQFLSPISAPNLSGTNTGDQSSVNDFRLTLTTALPVTTADVTGATTIYCCPYKGNQISLYDGAAWVTRSSAQFSLALGTLTSGKPYDVFCYDNAGTPTLEFLVWTNDTTRATALAYQDGVLVKSGAATRRYLGTFYTTSTTTTEDSDTKRYLWNYYNRVARRMFKTDSTYSWTYSTSSFRQANNSTANQINYVQGVSEDAIQATVHGSATTSAATIRVAYSAIGLDTTTAMSSSSFGGLTYLPNNLILGMTCTYSAHTAAGRHFLAWLEYGGGGDTQTWYCNSINGGIRGVILG